MLQDNSEYINSLRSGLKKTAAGYVKTINKIKKNDYLKRQALNAAITPEGRKSNFRNLGINNGNSLLRAGRDLNKATMIDNAWNQPIGSTINGASSTTLSPLVEGTRIQDSRNGKVALSPIGRIQYIRKIKGEAPLTYNDGILIGNPKDAPTKTLYGKNFVSLAKRDNLEVLKERGKHNTLANIALGHRRNNQ